MLAAAPLQSLRLPGDEFYHPGRAPGDAGRPGAAAALGRGLAPLSSCWTASEPFCSDTWLLVACLLPSGVSDHRPHPGGGSVLMGPCETESCVWAPASGVLRGSFRGWGSW